jgi:hypothetical protein
MIQTFLKNETEIVERLTPKLFLNMTTPLIFSLIDDLGFDHQTVDQTFPDLINRTMHVLIKLTNNEIEETEAIETIKALIGEYQITEKIYQEEHLEGMLMFIQMIGAVSTILIEILGEEDFNNLIADVIQIIFGELGYNYSDLDSWSNIKDELVDNVFSYAEGEIEIEECLEKLNTIRKK